MKTKTKRLIALLLVLSIALVGCTNNTNTNTTEAPEEDLKELTFVLDWTPNTNHIGVYVADALGYYEEAGLKVNIIQPPEDGVELMVASGQGDIGVSFQDILSQAYAEDTDLPITAVATILQHNTSGIMSRKYEGMDRPKGMEGHTYASWNWDIEQAIVENVVEADGGDWDKVDVIPSTATDEVSALETGQVDSIWVYYGWAGVAAEVADLDIDYFAFADIDPVFDYYTPVLVANNDLIENDPETLKAFLSATEKGYRYAKDNINEATEILVEADNALPEELVSASLEYLKDYFFEKDSWGHMYQQRWDDFFNWLYENGLITTQIPAGHGMSNDYLD